jgi:shikimate kinase
MKSIILTGLKHSGKSSLGLRLAEDLDIAFIDLDRVIETLYRADGSVGCREIYREHGKASFVDLEAQAAMQTAARLGAAPAVVALGGGTGENRKAMSRLAKAGVVVYLRDAERRLYERIMRGGRPAFLPAEAPEAAFHELFESRDALYREYAQVIVEIDRLDLDAAYSRLILRIEEHIDVG